MAGAERRLKGGKPLRSLGSPRRPAGRFLSRTAELVRELELLRACPERQRPVAGDAHHHRLDALDSRPAVRPRRGDTSTSQGRPRTVFARALQHGNLVVSEATARELGRISLAEALELTILIARKDPRRHPRVAARWLLRYLEDCPEATIDEAAMVAACVAALTGDRYQDATLTLRAVAERATSRALSRGIA